MPKTICRDKDQNKIEVATDKLQFRPSVYGIIFNKDRSKILLSNQWDGYDYPGGGINKGEQLQEALKREVYEEVGLKIKGNKLVEVEDSCFIHKKNKPWHTILIFYVVEEFEGEPNINNIGESESNYINGFEWISIENIKNIKWYNPMDNEQLVKKALEVIKN